MIELIETEVETQGRRQWSKLMLILVI